MTELQVDVTPDGRRAVVTLDRPRRLNALSRGLVRELAAKLAELGGRDGLRAVLLIGAGERAFSTGADLTERRRLSPAERRAHTEEIDAAAEAVAALPVPVIAAIRGYALAGGAELALACDLRVAAEDAVFGFPEVKIGIFPGAGGVLRLPALIGLGAARDLLYTGRRIEAADAYRLGLVDRLVPPAALLPAAEALAAEIAGNAPLAVRALKQALRARTGTVSSEVWQTVSELRRALDLSADYEEGLAAFAEKRAPRFRGA